MPRSCGPKSRTAPEPPFCYALSACGARGTDLNVCQPDRSEMPRRQSANLCSTTRSAHGISPVCTFNVVMITCIPLGSLPTGHGNRFCRSKWSGRPSTSVFRSAAHHRLLFMSERSRPAVRCRLLAPELCPPFTAAGCRPVSPGCLSCGGGGASGVCLSCPATLRSNSPDLMASPRAYITVNRLSGAFVPAS